MKFFLKIRIALRLAHLENGRGFDDHDLFIFLGGNLPKRRANIMTVCDQKVQGLDKKSIFSRVKFKVTVLHNLYCKGKSKFTKRTSGRKRNVCGNFGVRDIDGELIPISARSESRTWPSVCAFRSMRSNSH